MALALDGVSAVGSGSGTAITLHLTTTQPNDEIVVVVAPATGDSVTSVTAVGLSFSLRYAHAGVSEWYAVASSPLANVAITVNFAVAGANQACAFGVSGASTATPWDANAGVPAFIAGSGNPTASDLYSTSNANDFVLAAASLTSSGANPAGFSNAVGGNAVGLNVWYEIVSVKQTNAIVVVSGHPAFVLLDAIQALSGSIVQASLAESAHGADALHSVSARLAHLSEGAETFSAIRTGSLPAPLPIRVSLTGALN